MGDLVWFGLGFLRHENGVRFFPLLYAMRGFFFSAGYLFPKYFLAKFSLSKSVVGYVSSFSEITYTPPPKPNGQPLILFLAGEVRNLNMACNFEIF